VERLSDYDYDLPEDLIAQYPLADRADSRLLYLNKRNGRISHLVFRDLPGLLRKGDLLVLNDTRVSALRMHGEKPSGGKVELLVLDRADEGTFRVLAKPGRRLRPGARIEFGARFGATVEADLPEGMKQIRFDDDDALEDRLRSLGKIPLPPYVHGEIADPERYQTVFARMPGSSAAPTAGLHFTEQVLEQVVAMGVGVAWVTLTVGIDTFRPIQTADVSRHVMHGEQCELPEETAEAVNSCRGRIIAVGTTSVRTLESFATGVRRVSPGEMETRLFIRPGYRFQVIDGLLTNFHLPRTSMLLLVAALTGRERLFAAYTEAVAQRYRFLSFGDAMLVL
jgi:S-adenosylmethionine:tRNA ribosyltransferase-isomerase